jgi:shikimate dehydrogenase
MKRVKFGLIGHPLAHSISPALHQEALAAVGLVGDYTLHPIPPLPKGRVPLERILSVVRTGEIDGLNVTIPHKQNVITLLDRLGPEAEATGAVNTISLIDGSLTGDNTDVQGFRRDFNRTLSLAPGAAMVLGAGGAARAVAHVLLTDGWSVSVASRRKSQAEGLARQLRGIERISGLPPRPDLVEGLRLTLIVNATPVGMSPTVDASPWPEDLPLPAGCAVYDLVYNPSKTAFLKLARRQDAPAAGGLGMLVEQAALAFEIWTGLRPPVDRLHETAARELMAMRKDDR